MSVVKQLYISSFDKQAKVFFYLKRTPPIAINAVGSCCMMSLAKDLVKHLSLDLAVTEVLLL